MKIKFGSILLILSLFLTACNIGVDPKEHLGEIYSVALDSIMEKDEALSSEMKFIAIDMSNFDDGLSAKDKQDIITFFKDKYKMDVMVATFDELKEKGFYDPENMSLTGVLLRIEKVDFKWNHNVFFEGSKYRSGLGAIGVEGTVHYKDGTWQIKESKETWIS
ncbi:peptide ABC transporter substrate-binding protein [Neobacillus drentensis]|uniref:peptide ABC transporter substrate-binding protein n=1 Tax=Neobacillus drentensis TaxID=220684 RepID=UPI0008244AFD|nr:peptide ABC transporter substrate-binding protein [Neobacillus drentensis]